MEEFMNCILTKKAGFVYLLLLLAAGMIFAGGGGQQVPAGKPTLQVGIQTHQFITDYENNHLTHYIKDLHNIDIDFYFLPTDNTENRTKISLLVASNDLPETLWTLSITRDQILDYGSQGFLLELLLHP